MSEWLDRQLTAELAPVEAPDELWQRVQAGRLTVVPPRRQGRSPLLLVAAAAGLLVTAGAVWLWGNPATPTPGRVAQGSCYACHTM